LDAPLTGSLAAPGLGIKNSAQLAVDTANKKKYVDGVTFKLEAKDDQAQPSIGQQNATAFVAEQDLIGVVGPYNSSVSQSMQSTFASAHVVQISPANTNPTLTQGKDYTTDKKRPYDTYFRTITTDAVQSPYAAQYLYKNLGLKQVATVNDKKVYGAGQVAAFTAAFTKLGGKVVLAQTINPGDTDFSAVVNSIKNSPAQAVYYGGEYPEAGPLSKQLRAAGKKVPLIGGDAVYDDKYIELAGGKAADGDMTTSDGAPIDKLDSAKTFVADYQAAGFSETYGTFGAFAYDATWAIIESVKKIVDDNNGKVPSDGLRTQIVEAVQGIKFDGVTGTISFDEYGDTTNQVISINQVKDGAWAAGVNTGKLDE
jgi:branched-chain amino acid transport system substrate-binding protein